jgi:hypothetical protein
VKRWSCWWLALALALLFPGSISALALDDAPTIAPFKTAHLRIEGTINAQGQTLPIQGDGQIDAAHGASQLTIAVLGAVFETIVVDGRTYSRNVATGRWEYTEGTQAGGFNPARLAPYDPATIRAAGRNFTRVGPETIDGVPTTRWHADADLNLLLGLDGANTAATGLGQAATMDLWIGDADQHLHRLAIDAQSTASPAAAPASTTSAPARQSLTLTFDQFDADIVIIAPPGAVPATPGTLGGPGAIAASPIIGAPAAPTRITATNAAPALPSADPSADPNELTSPASILLVRVLGVVSFAAIALAFLIAYRHRRTRAHRPTPPGE